MYKIHNNPMTFLKYLQRKTIENKASLPNSENLQIVICAAFVITNREGHKYKVSTNYYVYTDFYYNNNKVFTDLHLNCFK